MSRSEDLTSIFADGDLKPRKFRKQRVPVAFDDRIVVHELGKRPWQRPQPSLQLGPLGQRKDLDAFSHPHVHTALKPDAYKNAGTSSPFTRSAFCSRSRTTAQLSPLTMTSAGLGREL